MRTRFEGLWRHPDFVRLWAGQTVSALGTTVTGAALPLTAILVLDASPFQLGLLSAAEAAPVLVVGLFVGAWVDRVRRRPLMLAADLGRAALIATIPAVALAGALHIGHLFVVMAAAAVLNVIFDVSYQALLPGLVGREHVVEGNSKLGQTSALAEMAGFSIGGVLVQYLTAPIALLVDAASFVVSAVSLMRIRAPEAPPAPPEAREGLRGEVVEGVRLVLGDARLRALVGATMTFGLSGGAFGALYFVFALRDLGLSPAVAGVVAACGGIGSFVGAGLAGRLSARFGIGRTTAWSLLVGGALQLLVPLAHGPTAQAAAFLVGAQILGDCALTSYLVQETSLRQMVTPEHVLGRVGSIAHLAAGAALPVGAVAGGLIGELASPRAGLAVAACGLALSSLWLFASPVRRLT